ncbi:hypothetical protein [Pyrobaculum neutrophilum]|uniref:hypothetical protein n=1 Tax=Pyrobaculum neutrophilum TaxID=70771 RepID=UPI00164F73A0|nr:hypothetical protein [Pyrobaculum neutrophilum]
MCGVRGGGGPRVGVHAYTLARYGVDPHDDVETAVKKLEAKAPHLAQFLREVAQL